MKFKIRFAEQIVGLFVLLALISTAVVLIFIGINQRWFAKNYSFTSTFTSADGLSAGMAIAFKGFEIGKISRISLNRDNTVDVHFSVEDVYYDRVKPDSILELTSSPIGLGTSLKFHPGKNDLAPLPEDSRIFSYDSEEGKKLVADGKVDIAKDADVIGSVIGQLNPLLNEARQTIAEIRRVAGSVNAAFQGTGGPVGTMVTDLSGTPARVNKAVDDITVRVNAILAKIDEVSTNLTDITVKADGVIGDLSTNLDAISKNLTVMTADLSNTQGLVKRLLDPKGSVDTILNDSNELYNQVDNALKSANSIIAQIKGFVEFINSTRPQVSSILEKGSDTLSTAKDVLEAAKNNPLLKGGVPATTQQAAPVSGYRDENF
jgi:phospholipid/cholesterol/gamma-HCH transport system substrate-binding protein